MFAVAGSGKTRQIVEDISPGARCLIFTYTDENARNIRAKILKKFGEVPAEVKVLTYFNFLYSFCFRPSVGLTMKYRGICYPDEIARSGYGAADDAYYKDASGRVYHSRLSKLLIERRLMEYVRERLAMFFDRVYVDEVQDFASHDFDFLLELSKINLPFLMVGDFYQHTYDTSRDGNKGGGLHDDFEKYKVRFKKAGIEVDTESLSKSHRCSPEICKFVSEKLGIAIESASNRSATVRFASTREEADAIWGREDIVKLFLQEHYKYQCFSQNWGRSKGEDHYDEICIVLNKTTLQLYNLDRLAMLSDQTLRKLYVALTRSRGDVHFVPHTHFDHRKRPKNACKVG